MPRTFLVKFVPLAFLGLLVPSLAAQDTPTPTVQRPTALQSTLAVAEPKTKGKAKAGGEDDSEGKSKESPASVLLPQMLVVGKIDALCAADQFLVRIRPIGPQFAGTPPCPPWLVVDSKVTPQASTLLLKAAEKSWTVAVYFDPTWTVTSVCVRFFPGEDLGATEAILRSPLNA